MNELADHYEEEVSAFYEPCSTCVHRNGDIRDYPCNECKHNMDAVKEADKPSREVGRY